MSFGANTVKPMGTLPTGAPALTASARPYHIAVDWKLPADLQNAPGFSIAHFNLYRKANAPPDWTPTAADLYQTLPDNQYAYADTNVLPGATYCYAVTYLHDDCQGGLTESPFSNVSCAQICEDGCSTPEILITGNNAIGCRTNDIYGSGALETYDFSDGSLVNWFIPSGAVDGVVGRGLAIYNGTVYYTEVVGVGGVVGNVSGYAPTPNIIHICSYGTEGSGPKPVTDSGTIPNPDNRHDQNGNYAGIQDLAFQIDPKTGMKELFVLSGYGHWQPEMSEIDPTTGNLILNGSVPNGQILISSPASVSSDGFAVQLENGTLYFLINEDDRSPVYDKYDTSGTKVAGWIDLSQYGFSNGYGVATAPDGTLYFNTGQSLVHFDSNGNFLSAQIISICSPLEDIDVVVMP